MQTAQATRPRLVLSEPQVRVQITFYADVYGSVGDAFRWLIDHRVDYDEHRVSGASSFRIKSAKEDAISVAVEQDYAKASS